MGRPLGTYDPFLTKRSHLSSGTPLKCGDHPLFEDIPEILEEQKSFYDRGFATEGDIFEGFVFNCAPMKMLILEEMYKGVLKLAPFTILGVPIM